MPFDARGLYKRFFNWCRDRDAGIPILADRMDKETDGIVDAINATITNKVDKTAISDAIDYDSHNKVASSRAIKKLNEANVSKTGDTISGKLVAKDIYYPFENQNTAKEDYSKDNTCTVARAVLSDFKLAGGLYVSQCKTNYHAVVIELSKPKYYNNWQFRSDGHIYGSHGRLVVESKLNKKVNKTGDTLSGTLNFNNVAQAIRVNSPNTQADRYGHFGAVPYGVVASNGSHKIDIYQHALGHNDGKAALHSEITSNTQHAGFEMNSDGYLYTNHGRLVNVNELNTKADKSYADAINAKTNNKSQVAILTGTIGHGGTIPLPVGFAESQCRWTVSPRSLCDKGKLGAFECYADTRKVYSVEFYSDNRYWRDTTANYIIIGVK